MNHEVKSGDILEFRLPVTHKDGSVSELVSVNIPSEEPGKHLSIEVIKGFPGLDGVKIRCHEREGIALEEVPCIHVSYTNALIIKHFLERELS